MTKETRLFLFLKIQKIMIQERIAAFLRMIQLMMIPSFLSNHLMIKETKLYGKLHDRTARTSKENHYLIQMMFMKIFLRKVKLHLKS